jgi:hypothetical protein
MSPSAAIATALNVCVAPGSVPASVVTIPKLGSSVPSDR